MFRYAIIITHAHNYKMNTARSQDLAELLSLVKQSMLVENTWYGEYTCLYISKLIAKSWINSLMPMMDISELASISSFN